MKIEFNIPKRHYASGDTTPFRCHIPEKTWEALEKRSESLGWTTNQLVGLVLDQFFHAIKSQSRLPERQIHHFFDDRQGFSIRIDKSLSEELTKWSKKAQTQKTKLILLAFDFYLYP